MTDNINPSHYKDGPFECIELSRLLSSDWGQAVQYFKRVHRHHIGCDSDTLRAHAVGRVCMHLRP